MVVLELLCLCVHQTSVAGEAAHPEVVLAGGAGLHPLPTHQGPQDEARGRGRQGGQVTQVLQGQQTAHYLKLI